MQQRGRRVTRAAWNMDGQATGQGTFVLPTVIELTSISELEREVFGPVLHVVRFGRKDLPSLLQQINQTGYGLTLGVHTRIDETIATVVDAAHAGNVYVNRNMVGAVVGVQPFGGEGLSGTGPKAGGPLYLYRLLSRRPEGVLEQVREHLAQAGATMVAGKPNDENKALSALSAWAASANRTALAAQCSFFDKAARTVHACELRGPTGERNLYSLVPREAVLCLASDDESQLFQLAAVLAVRSRAVLPAQAKALVNSLPPVVRASCELVPDWQAPEVFFDAVLHHGDPASLMALNQTLAEREGAVIGVNSMTAVGAQVPVERLLMERSLSVNTAAAGGNASLMTIA